MANRCVKWTQEEDEVVVRYVKNHLHNLHRCFILVSEHLTDAGTPRTPTAVQARWYSVISKRPEVLCFFTASSQSLSKNRKNGLGILLAASIWRRLVNIIRNL